VPDPLTPLVILAAAGVAVVVTAAGVPFLLSLRAVLI